MNCNCVLPVFLFSMTLVMSSRLVAAPPEDVQGPLLEVFTSGEAQGFNSVFKGRRFTAKLGPDRVLCLQMRDDAGEIGKPVQVRCVVFDGSQDRQYSRLRLTAFQRSPKPSIQPQKVEYVGEFEGHVRVQILFSFSENSVSVSGEISAPGALKRSIGFHNMVTFPATHTFPAGTAEAQIAAATGSSTLRLLCKGEAAKSGDYAYSSILSSTRGVSRALLNGPWGGVGLALDMPTSKMSPHGGSFWNYSNVPLYKGGWSIGASARDGVSSGPLTISVN